MLRCRFLRRRGIWIRAFAYLSILSAISFSIQVIISKENAFYNPPAAHFNYFMEADEFGKLGYVVDTPNCHILNISAWDKSVLPFLNSEPPSTNCSINRQWTFMDDQQRLVINKTALGESGFTLNSISCCFRPILRVHQTLDNYNSDADTQVIFSKECKPMDEFTKLGEEDEFVRVFCTSKYWPWSMDVIYRYFHAVPLPLKKVKEKINFWAKSKTNKNSHKRNINPPNVILLGIDSMSRLSFQRNMKKTRLYLQEIGAMEMFGYTKLGENTFPNAIAFNTGHQIEELSSVCNYSLSRPLDNCPFIWKDFSSSNYLTAFIEDVPFLATFNHYKTGFVQQPVDFYFRPFMLGIHYHAPRMHYYTMDCIGKQTVDETIHKYIEDILKLSKKSATPVFINTWITNLAHVDLNAAQHADGTYLEFLKRIDLSNTILFFMSDHGYRYGLIRQTFAGWYEDKLPNFWVYIPPMVKQRFPEWATALQINSQRLSSPLDLHATLVDILQSFSLKPKGKSYPKPFEKSKKLGNSLFREIPKLRTCKDAGVSENFCACVAPRRLELNDTHLGFAAEAALFSINSKLPQYCAQLTLSSLLAGGIMEKVQEDGSPIITYIVAFETNPAGFVFEGNVDYYPQMEKYELIGDLLRMNKITTDVSCVKTDYLEKFCYCGGEPK